MEIKNINFNLETIDNLDKEWFGKNWPVVYILNGKKEAYVGESSQVKSRLKNHYNNVERKNLHAVNIIFDDTFNKSAIVDIESKLIEYMAADQKYELQNANAGLRNHEYYDKNFYQEMFKDLWRKLKKEELVQHDLHVLENSDLFKYSPYKSLTDEQYDLVFKLVLDLIDAIANNESSTMVINGEAGTGKTVIAMYIMKLLADKNVLDIISEENETYKSLYGSIQEKLANFNFALVVPMTSLRATLQKVMRNIKGLKSNMVIGPTDIDKENYDLLIVDEAHRLAKGKHITNYHAHYSFNKRHGWHKQSSQLKWAIELSKHQILFFDKKQTIRPSDANLDEFNELINQTNYHEYTLTSQMRVKGGDSYINYVKSIFSDQPPAEKLEVSNYEFYIYDNIIDLKQYIIKKDQELGLSRMIAGYGYEWISKNKSLAEIEANDLHDIVIQGEKMIWNRTLKGWPTSENAINEVGSIHTIQGFDLNYAGVIIGKEIYFDINDNKIKVNKELYFDRNGKQSTSDEELIAYVKNIYGVLLTRAIKGTLLYVEDPNLKTYLKQYISTVK